MASLVYESKLNVVLEDMIRDAEEELVFFCPYFKLHDRLKDCLKLRIDDHKLNIVIIFGKNEDDPSKSLSKEDFEFLKSFPNIIIAYEKRLHAKYYANEKNGLITSLNLHTYSQNNNIEVGVYFKTKGILKNITDRALGGLTSIISDTEDIATEATDYFNDVYKNAEKIFDREPQYESVMLGLQKKYSRSVVKLDISKSFFNQKRVEYNHPREESNNYFKAKNSTQPAYVQMQYPSQGYCLRTRQSIPFDPGKPLSYDAYQSWAQFGNPDYNEKYCHGCGRNWRTSVRNPLCNECLLKFR